MNSSSLRRAQARKILLGFHLWAGLTATIFLALLGITGSLIVFEDEIDSWLNPRPHVNPASERLSLNTLTARLEAACPSYQVAGFTFPSRNDIPFAAFLHSEKLRKNMGVDINPNTGQVFPATSQKNNFTGHVHQLHTHLLMGRAGSTVMAFAAVFLLFLAVTGLILWWPRKIFTIRWSGHGLRLNFDLHNALGIYSSLFLLIFAFSGMVIHWENLASNLIRYVTRTPVEAAMADASPPVAEATSISADQALAIAESAAPGARPTFMQLGPDGPMRIAMKFPEDHTPAGRTIVLIDRYTGKILSLKNTRTASTAYKYPRMWNREIHTGDLFGWPTRIVACLSSLTLPVMAITGPLIWWNRRRKGAGIAK
jgi:uncharacterized iron-regulated membrane protein